MLDIALSYERLAIHIEAETVRKRRAIAALRALKRARQRASVQHL